MPLSDYERRILDETESELLAADPELASVLGSGVLPKASRRIFIGAMLFSAGLAMMLVGITAFQALVVGVAALSILGYLAMFAGASYALTGTIRIGDWFGR